MPVEITTRLNAADRHRLENALHGRPRKARLRLPPSAARAFLAWELVRHFPRAWLWITDGPATMDILFNDMLALQPAGQSTPLLIPPAGDPDRLGARMKSLYDCLNTPSPLVVTCIQALMQPVLPPGKFTKSSFTLRRGDSIGMDDVNQRLERSGYVPESEVNREGQFARRGGILDVWPPGSPHPLRLEFFGDLLESIRSFDPISQLTIQRMENTVLLPVDTNILTGTRATHACLTTYLPADCGIVWNDFSAIKVHAEAAREESGRQTEVIPLESVRRRLTRIAGGGTLSLEMTASAGPDLAAVQSPPPAASLHGIPLDTIMQQRREFIDRVNSLAREGSEVHLFFDSQGGRERFLQSWGKTLCIPPDNIHIAVLSEGFTYENNRLLVVTESDIYGYPADRARTYFTARRQERPPAGTPLSAWTDLQPGDLVVHVDHGIGKYLGLYEVVFQGERQEVLALEYDAGARLYVPVSQVHLLSRYVGVGRHRPDLHRLGGRRWLREKAAARKAIRDLAASLLETQARRETLHGYAFGPDTEWQREFEAGFPFPETEDQRRAVAEIKRDMESPRPMDRLICGDVGYGKTEVAMRAAFKAVMDGKQVAVLVPTTVLAQQHLETFRRRMAAFPISIEMLSRFRTPAEQQEIIRRLAGGAVDIIIGTHRLIQPDVRFHALQLVIIDEEQRFGVAHKERFKEMRRLVDVLTLTATPIPRTLYLSLTGARDLSTIQTPPRERLPIETIVAENDDEVVRAAVLHELNREGQVFYLHNRIDTIARTARRLQRLVPHARISIAHGRMNDAELAEVMHRFASGQTDVLVCTTIIESGVDIPNVNTIIIEHADRFGMADLYQLRGRVGRYKHQAYAYLLLPRHGRLFDAARRRIRALQRHTSLGAGFKLALQDLEIRGAGNILGTEQSGHIAAVGFDLYCQLLRRTIAQLKGEPLPAVINVEIRLDFINCSTHPDDQQAAAAIPYEFIEDETLRLTIYRRIAATATEEEVTELTNEIHDRFGPLPPPLKRLLQLTRLRIAAARCGIHAITVRDGKIMLTRDGDYIMRRGRFPRLKSSNPDERLAEIISLVRECCAPDHPSRG